MSNSVKAIALGPRLRKCKNVITLGVRPNFSDYTREEIKTIQKAPKIYYPGTFYGDLLDSAGIKTFPSYHNYKTVQDKIKQSTLFNILALPHPKTRFFYGDRQKNKILDYFRFPFIAKIPKGSSMGRGVFLIENHQDLLSYSKKTRIAYIQEYFKADRDIRVVIIGQKVAHAYFRIAAPGEFKTNISAGGTISLEPVPKEAIMIALETAKKFHWDDVGIDIIKHKNKYYLLEANMKYGKEGFRKAGIDYHKMMEQKIENGDI